jgi:hypothetical protein
MRISPDLESFLIRDIPRAGHFLWVFAAVSAPDFSIATVLHRQKMGFSR